ncbi:MAG: hypothetical protein RXP28_08485 [Nitrososphaeria archaeon]
MKTKTIVGLTLIIVLIIAVSGLYLYTERTHSQKLVGSTFYYEYIISIPNNGTYVNMIKIHVISVKDNSVVFNYLIIPLNGTVKNKYSNQSFIPIFDPTNNMTYFKSGSFGMPLFINSSVKNASGSTYIEFQGNQSVYIKYSVLRSSEINVSLTLIPYLYSYNLGASYWNLVYDGSYGYLIYAKGGLVGSNYVSFEYKLVNSSV